MSAALPEWRTCQVVCGNNGGIVVDSGTVSELATSNVLPVGLGCLSIVPEVDVASNPERADGKWWEATLTSGVGSLSSVTDLEVSIRGLSRGRSFGSELSVDEFGGDYTNLDIEAYGVPAKGSYVKFIVTIPSRMHAELTRSTLHGDAPETFEFRTVYGYRGPVTFVRPLGWDGAEDRGPSMYMVLMREFLKREFERANVTVRVAPTGPSPFHADVHVRPMAGALDGVDHAWEVVEYGYDKIDLFYDPDRTTPKDAYENIVESLTDPFATYYFLVRSKYRNMKRAISVGRMTNDLISIHSRGGIRAWLSKTVRSGKMARELLLEALEAKFSESSRQAYLRENVLPGTLIWPLPALAGRCDREVATTFVDQFTLAEEIARTLEGGRVSQYEVLVLSSSTLLGALAGAVAALIAH